jgi:hypothetical protein
VRGTGRSSCAAPGNFHARHRAIHMRGTRRSTARLMMPKIVKRYFKLT